MPADPLPAMPPPMPSEVAAVFAAGPSELRPRLDALRRLILETAAATAGVGPLTECLKWGEPAYLTAATKAGSTIRIGWKASSPGRCALLFNCRTGLVDSFRQSFPDDLLYEGNRAVILPPGAPLPKAVLRRCIAMALTYHRDRRRRPAQGGGRG